MFTKSISISYIRDKQSRFCFINYNDFVCFLYGINILISEYLFFLYKESQKVIREIVCILKNEDNARSDKDIFKNDFGSI